MVEDDFRLSQNSRVRFDPANPIQRLLMYMYDCHSGVCPIEACWG